MDKVPLKDYVDCRFDAMDKAALLAENNMRLRLESMNEFRQQANDRMATYVTREAHDSTCDRLNALERNAAKMDGKASQGALYFAMAISILGLLIAATGLLVKLR